LDFRLIDQDVSTLSRVLDWQQQNLRRNGTLFLPQKPWHEALYREALSQNTEAFSGWFSTLRTSHGMISGNVFLRSYDTAHWWLTAYDAEHGQHSPSAVALLHALEEAAALGITRVDFGRGRQELKRRLMSSSDLVREGLVEARPVVRIFRRAWQQSCHWVWNSPLKSAAKDAVRRWRTWRGEDLPVNEAATCEAESND
jgi:CelD/BcsL family acetyltransferase involved in cellulose biosynthesis